MKREEVVRGLERFIDDFKPFCGNRADWQRVYDALALLKEQGPKAKPQFDDDALDRNTYIKVGDLIDCMTELLMPEDAAFLLEGAIEWACGKRAVALLKEQEPRVLTLEELHPDLWIWMEYPGEEEGYDKYIGYAYLEGRMIEDWWFSTAGAKERLVCPLKSYGQVWRCWTSRPTEQQMRETKWEEVRRET